MAGERFVDPQGTYTMSIDDGWTRTPGLIAQEVELWTIAPPADGFADNVNVLTQDAPNMDLDGYLELSVKGMGKLELIETLTLVGASGNELGLLEYKGVPPFATTDISLHCLAIVDVRDEVAIMATLSTTEATFDARRPSVEPYLLTLEAT